MLDQWLEQHQQEIQDGYVSARRERDDSRPDEILRSMAEQAITLLIGSLRGESDWTEGITVSGRRMLDTGQALYSAASESMYLLYLTMRQILDKEEPAQHIEWLGVLGEYTLLGSQTVTKVLETSLEEQVAARTKELRRLAAMLDNTTDLVSMVDMQGHVLYVNNAGLEMVGRAGQDLTALNIPDFHPPEVAQQTLDEHVPILMAQGVHSWESVVQHTDGHTIPVSQVSTLIRNEDGEPEAIAAIMRDLTEQKQAEAEREKLQREVIEAQQQALKELATPIIPIMDRIIVLPLIGSIDSMRARDITRTLLSGIGQYRAKIVILDITGVSLIDSGVANHLNKTIQAARLKGARTIVTGMSDAVAETIVDLGIDWSDMTTLSDLQTGLIVALDSLGVKLSNV